MEVQGWLYCIVFNYLLIKCLIAKPFSLNEAIAAESQQKEAVETTLRPKLSEATAERFTLNKALAPTFVKSKKFEEIEKFISLGKKISPLKYRKRFQIKIPLKPKKLRHTSKLRYKRKNQSIKREVSEDEQFNQKYIPLLKSIGMLFDNLLGPDTSDSFEIRSRKQKRNRYHSDERDGLVCKCTRRSDTDSGEYKSQEKATAPTSTLTAKVSFNTEAVSVIETTTTTTDYTPFSDISSVRQHKNVPILSPRDTISSRRDHHGVSERSGTAHNWSIKRNISWNNGDSEHTTRSRENESYTQSDEETTYGSPRDNASSDETYGNRIGNGNTTRSSNFGNATDENDENSEDEITIKDNRNSYELKGEDKLEIGGDEAKSAESLSKLVRRLRGSIPEDEISHDTEPIQFQEVDEESEIDVTRNSAGHKRVSDRSRANTTENKKVRPRNETMIIDKGMPILNTTSHNAKNNTPVVMIIDGYSVTRHKNGENKLSKKAIHLHS